MPSPLESAAIRAGVRDAITDTVAGATAADGLNAGLEHLGQQGGQTALLAVASLTLNGMLALKEASPGAQMGGIAGFLQKSVVRFGEPHASICRGILEALRQSQGGRLNDPKFERALDDVWNRLGPAAVGHGASLILRLYIQVASAQGCSVVEAWASAAEHDEREVDQLLASPAVAAEQRLWDAGLCQEEISALYARIGALLIGAQASGAESVSIADLASTPGQESALRDFVDVLRAEARRGRDAEGQDGSDGA